MKSITIPGSLRKEVGKVSAKSLRNEGKVPCILYGGESAPVHFSADELSFSKLVYTPDVHTVSIELEGGNTYPAVVQEIQFHPVSDKILHVDFYRLHEKKEVTMEVPLHIVGRSKGVLAGGVLEKNKRKLKIKALPGNLPDFIEADITNLNVGDKLYITALRNEAYSFLHPDNTVICQVRRSRATVEPAASAEEGKKEEPKTAEAKE